MGRALPEVGHETEARRLVDEADEVQAATAGLGGHPHSVPDLRKVEVSPVEPHGLGVVAPVPVLRRLCVPMKPIELVQVRGRLRQFPVRLDLLHGDTN